jgi:dihydroxy-acid dehydratase
MEVELTNPRVPAAGSGNGAAPILNRQSRHLTQNPERGGAQAMLHAAGLTVADLDKAQVGISAVWWEGNPCNSHLRELADWVKESCTKEGLVGLQFNTIGE